MVIFREGSGHAKLTHPFLGRAGVKIREESCPSKLTHPFVGNAGVKFREGSGHAKLTHPFVANAGKWPFQVGLPFGEPPKGKV